MSGCPADRVMIWHDESVGDPDAMWRVYLPPRGPQDYEGGDVEDGAITGPYGDSFWPTAAEACSFVATVLTEDSARQACYTDRMTTPTTDAAETVWNQLTDQQKNTLTVAAIAHRATDRGDLDLTSDMEDAHGAIHDLIHTALGYETTVDIEHLLLERATAPTPAAPVILSSTFTPTVILTDSEDGLEVTVDWVDSYQNTVDNEKQEFGRDEHGHSDALDRILGVGEYTTAGQLRRLADWIDGIR